MKNRLNAAFNNVEDVQKMRNSLPAYENYAKKQQYYFAQGNTENDNEPILFGDDGTNCTRLGRAATLDNLFSPRTGTEISYVPLQHNMQFSPMFPYVPLQILYFPYKYCIFVWKIHWAV
jgi:hypothetical protein